eukprot:scaffold6704_cov137-Isochrysis_galbana.AAC.2
MIGYLVIGLALCLCLCAVPPAAGSCPCACYSSWFACVCRVCRVECICVSCRRRAAHARLPVARMSLTLTSPAWDAGGKKESALASGDSAGHPLSIAVPSLPLPLPIHSPPLLLIQAVFCGGMVSELRALQQPGLEY